MEGQIIKNALSYAKKICLYVYTIHICLTSPPPLIYHGVFVLFFGYRRIFALFFCIYTKPTKKIILLPKTMICSSAIATVQDNVGGAGAGQQQGHTFNIDFRTVEKNENSTLYRGGVG